MSHVQVCPACKRPVRPCRCGFESCKHQPRHIHSGRTACDDRQETTGAQLRILAHSWIARSREMTHVHEREVLRSCSAQLLATLYKPPQERTGR